METETFIKKDSIAIQRSYNLHLKETSLFFADDFEYLEKYFDICSLMVKKQKLLHELSEKEDKRICKNKNILPIEQSIAKLNRKIKKDDYLFWQNVEKHPDQKKNHVIEKIAFYYGLSLFEKKMLLLFLYLEYASANQSTISKSDLLDIFDFECSMTSKLKNAAYLLKDRALIKNEIILKESNSSYNHSVDKYFLSDCFLEKVHKMLNGEKVDLGKNDVVEDKSLAECSRIGYVKSPEYNLDNVIYKEEEKQKIRMFLDAQKGGEFKKIGLYDKVKKGRGLGFLFYGPPGTGKSMFAEAIASYLGKKVLIVEFPKIMGSLLGETDKSIARIFNSAKDNDLVVIVDEADALLYNRRYAQWEHDIRFVNIMLHELERFEGVIILTTNMEILLDTAAERRIALKMKFELPDEKMRFEIWRTHIPAGITLSDNINFDYVAKKYKFSGGNIKNAVLNAVRKVVTEKRQTLRTEELIFGADIEEEGMFSKEREKTIVGFSKM